MLSTISGWVALLAGFIAMASSPATATQPARRVMYLTGQHPNTPEIPSLQSVTHVILAFMRSDVFNLDTPPEPYPLFTTIDEVRPKFNEKAMIMVAIGGWGDSEGFETAARSEEARKVWARNVKVMVDKTGADGIDIDWEYPGGNRDDYKRIPNSERTWEIEGFVSLLEELRAALGSEKLLSIATPACERDLMAFTKDTMPRIVESVDFINVMTYDMMNRRDTVVKHHSGVQDTLIALDRYVRLGAPSEMLNLGLGHYVKWFMADPSCTTADPLGCPTQLLEDPTTGDDLGKTGAFSFNDQVPADLVASYRRAITRGKYFRDGNYGYLDDKENRWWTFDTPNVVRLKLKVIMSQLDLGGVFAWGLGEDGPRFENFKATMRGMDEMEEEARDEL